MGIYYTGNIEHLNVGSNLFLFDIILIIIISIITFDIINISAKANTVAQIPRI